MSVKVKYEYTSEVGKVRENNEDSVGLFEVGNSLLAILCDGLGGNNAGEVASKMCVDKISEHFSDSDEVDVLERLRKGIRIANEAIIRKSSEEESLNNMSTTAEVVFLENNTLYWAHVGDSRIYNFKNGKLKQLTKDHSLVQKLMDEGKLTVAQAEFFPNKNVIMRAVGSHKEVIPDVSKFRFRNGEPQKIFICSDGVHGVISDDELGKILKKGNLNVIKEDLINLIEDRGSPDNYSFIILSSD